jgi:hypothetical protein
MKCAEPTRLHRKSGEWGTRSFCCPYRKPVIVLPFAAASRLLEMTILFKDGIPRLQEI